MAVAGGLSRPPSLPAPSRPRIVDALRGCRSRGILRTGIGEVGGGHWSPIAAYAEQADMMLLLDVSQYKYPPVWVKTDDLYTAMNTVDSTSGKSRGWVEVEP